MRTLVGYEKYTAIRHVKEFLADRTNGRAIGTVLRLSSVCNVMYCG